MMARCCWTMWKVLAVGFLMALFLTACRVHKEKRAASEYDFTLKDLKGQEVSLSDFEDRVIMVNFWAPWCGPCRIETPDLIALSDQYKSRGLQILGVAVAFQGEQSVRDFAAQAGISYPVLLGNDELVRAYGGFRGIPTTFLFARDGSLYRKYEGMRSRSVFEQDIKALLQ